MDSGDVGNGGHIFAGNFIQSAAEFNSQRYGGTERYSGVLRRSGFIVVKAQPPFKYQRWQSMAPCRGQLAATARTKFGAYGGFRHRHYVAVYAHGGALLLN